MPGDWKFKVDELLDLLMKGDLGWDEAGSILRKLASNPDAAVAGLLMPLDKGDLDGLKVLQKKDPEGRAEVLVARLRQERGRKVPGWRVVKAMNGGAA